MECVTNSLGINKIINSNGETRSNRHTYIFIITMLSLILVPISTLIFHFNKQLYHYHFHHFLIYWISKQFKFFSTKFYIDLHRKIVLQTQISYKLKTPTVPINQHISLMWIVTQFFLLAVNFNNSIIWT